MTAMNRSPPSGLQLGEGPELQGFRGAPVHRWDRTEGKREALSTAQQPWHWWIGGLHAQHAAWSCDSALKCN